MTAYQNPQQDRLSHSLTLLIAIACGAMVANLYYAQTLIDSIGPEIGLSPQAAGLITTLTQLGYGAGLILLVPLADLYENKRLALLATAGTILGSLGIAFSNGPLPFLIASLITGVCATGAQVLLPLASHLAGEHRQGRAIGTIMSGLLTGIMLARPVASFVAHAFGWRAIFLLSATVMAAIGVALLVACPERRPSMRIHYRTILASTLRQLAERPVLRRRALYQAVLFALFNLFWTAAPLALLHRFGFDQAEVALFALAGAGGALAAPLAGRLADHGKTWWTSLGAMLLAALCFAASGLAVAAGAVIVFALMAFLIDAAVQMNQITGQQLIFALSREARGRINAAYMTVIFVIGASGSVLGSAIYGAGGWAACAAFGALASAVLLIAFLLFDRGASGTRRG